MKILGIDSSTSIVAFAIIESDDMSIISVTHCDLSKKVGLIAKAEALSDFLDQFVGQVEAVAMEESLLMFQGGSSSASVIATLQQFSGIVQWLIKITFGYQPTMINVSTARKLAFGSISYPKGIKRKEVIYQRVYKEYPHLDLPLKKTGKPKDFVYDQCDAIVIGLAHAKNRGNNVKPNLQHKQTKGTGSSI